MSKNRVYAGIDLDAVLSNLESMHKNINSDTKLCAVIKANGYGHGALKIAETIEELPYIWGFAVATVEEALALIEDGRKKPALILGIAFENEYEEIVSNDIRPTVCDYGVAQKLSEIAKTMNKTCRIHLAIDTGMSRIGFQVKEDTADIIEAISVLPNIEIEGIFTHFHGADEKDKTSTYNQIALFKRMIEMLQARNITIPIKHCSNSAGIVEIGDANFDMVRAGITMYGLWPSEDVSREILSLKPAMTIRSHITFIKDLEPGRTVSYGGTYVTEKTTRIATIPVGYADGYARGLSNKGYVLVHGQKAYICGRVCMDQFMVDVTDIPDVKEGDLVTLVGTDGKETITMETLGELSGRFNYEFACLIAPRVPRIYYRK